MEQYVCGIDVGTSAVRVLISDRQGRIAASGAADLAPPWTDGVRREQDADDWWRATCTALRQALASVPAASVAALSVDATSGTIVLVDGAQKPLGRGLMYNDGRAAGYAERLNAAAGEFTTRHGYRFKDDFSLAKMLWLQEHDPAWAQADKVLHQSDFINAGLMGTVPATDFSNALKSGADLHRAEWPGFLGTALGLNLNKLPPRIVAPGTQIGVVGATGATATGLAPGTAVVAGASDGTASLFASGAAAVGDFNTALGSTITIKGIAARIVHDPNGVIYCHRHPAGYWLPGGAGNVGCTALNREFAPDATTRATILKQLDAQAAAFLPTPMLVYPLGDATTERFPFKKTGIGTLALGEPRSRAEQYAAYLQGIAFVERWCYEVLTALGAEARCIYATGGGSRSPLWCQLRADILRRPLRIPENTETAFGAALLAAGHVFGDFVQASRSMTRCRRELEPGPAVYDDGYHRFRDTCRSRWGV